MPILAKLCLFYELGHWHTGDYTLNNPLFYVTRAISMGVSLGLVLYEFGY
jgi:hypothetical protein